MAKRLVSDHAEDVGGQIVEPGQELPDDADDEVVERLDEEGKLGDAEQAEQTEQAEPAARSRKREG